jgi:hypothetical protein
MRVHPCSRAVAKRFGFLRHSALAAACEARSVVQHQPQTPNGRPIPFAFNGIHSRMCERLRSKLVEQER